MLQGYAAILANNNSEQFIYQFHMNKMSLFLPLLLKSSTNTISSSIDGGDLFKTLFTVLISVDHPSL
jgi:hypothetical protein